MHKLWLKPLSHICNNYVKHTLDFASRHLASLKSSQCPGKAKMFMDPKCKVALITGGADGIGFATAQALLARGARGIVLVGLDFSAGQQAVNILNCAFGKKKAIFVKANVAEKSELHEAYRITIKEYEKLDIVVNAAGIFNDKEYMKSLHTNVAGILHSTGLGFELLMKNKAGRDGVIVNLCGISGLDPLVGAPGETCWSHAVVGFCRSIGDHFHYRRTRVRIVVLCVGYTNTSYYKDALKTSVSENFANRLRSDLRKSRRQNPDVCGKAIIQIIKYGQSGTVFVCNSSNLYIIDMPKWKSNSTLVSQFI